MNAIDWPARCEALADAWVKLADHMAGTGHHASAQSITRCADELRALIAVAGDVAAREAAIKAISQ
jgi:hypothetical protein